MKKQICSGMTLLELMIVIAIIGLLAAFAVPTYNDHLAKARRNAGLVALLEATTQLERYYLQHHTYNGAPLNTQDAWYTYTLGNLSVTTYTVTATPRGTQAINDVTCGALSINQYGQKSISGTAPIAQCWT